MANLTPGTRIDPTLPLTWESPDTIRLGFETAVARLTRPTAGMQRLVGALRRGVTGDDMPLLLHRYGAQPAEWAALVTALEPALTVPRDKAQGTTAPLSIAVLGESRTVPPVVGALLRAGCRVAVYGREDSVPAPSPHDARQFDLAVIIERFIERPEDTGMLRVAGAPQLLIRFTDRSMQIGPIVTPRGAPCLSCVILGDLDADPHLLAVAAQLLGRSPAALSPASLESAAAYAAVLVQHWLAASRAPQLMRWRIPVVEGLPLPHRLTVDRVRAHTECGCALIDARSSLPRQ